MDNKTAIVVLGSPRSGTSALTRLLAAFGIDLGDEMVPANPNNPRGFWEDTAIQHINTDLLKLADRHLGLPGLSRTRVDSSSEYDRLHQEAKSLLGQRFATRELWAFKDPRMNRLLFFWQPVFAEMSCQANYLLALRNPAAVADSLCASSGLRRLTGLALWLECTVRAVQDTLAYPNLTISYENLLSDPRKQLQRIAAAFHLESHQMEREIQFYETHFLDRSLVHATSADDDLRHNTQDFPLVADVYELLRDQSNDVFSETDFQNKWSSLYARYEVEFPAVLAANPWLQKQDDISASLIQRFYKRVSFHGAGEFQRLGRRLVEKIITGI